MTIMDEKQLQNIYVKVITLTGLANIYFDIDNEDVGPMKKQK